MSGTRDALRRQLVDAEQALYRAQVAGDVEAIEPMLADDLVYIHSTGVAESKDEYLAGVANTLYEYGRIESHDTRLRVADQVGIIDGVVDMTVSAHGAPKVLIHLLFCLIWSRQNGGWRLTFRQATRIPPKPG